MVTCTPRDGFFGKDYLIQNNGEGLIAATDSILFFVRMNFFWHFLHRATNIQLQLKNLFLSHLTQIWDGPSSTPQIPLLLLSTACLELEKWAFVGDRTPHLRTKIGE